MDRDAVVAKLMDLRGGGNALPSDPGLLRAVAERLFEVCDISCTGELNETEMALLLKHLPQDAHDLPERAPRYSSDAAQFVLKSRLEWIKGIAGKLSPLVKRSVEQECTLSLGGKYREQYDYVVNQVAQCKAQLLADGRPQLDTHGVSIIFDEGHDGAPPRSNPAMLTPCHPHADASSASQA
jgi:hypothetical protein